MAKPPVWRRKSKRTHLIQKIGKHDVSVNLSISPDVNEELSELPLPRRSQIGRACVEGENDEIDLKITKVITMDDDPSSESSNRGVCRKFASSELRPLWPYSDNPEEVARCASGGRAPKGVLAR